MSKNPRGKRVREEKSNPMLSVPKLLADRYEVVRRVGTGGMADVYLARDAQLDRQVALKILHQQYADDPSFVDRFRREAQAAANLQHPNIVQIYDWGRENTFHFIVMEFIEGRSLRDFLAAEAPVEPREACRIAEKVLAALGYAHRSGLVHRDVKPGNILLGDDGEVHVTDFGIARATASSTITQTGTILGTAYYLSPEQAQGQPLDGRSDLYSLAIVLYEMLTGHRPFEGDSPVAIAYKHVRENPKPPSHLQPDIPRPLEAIILTALHKRPEDRYSSAGLMRRDLEGFLEGRDITATVATPAPEDDTQVLRTVGPVQRAAARRPGWLVALALALLAGGLALGAWSLVTLLRPAIGSSEVPSIVSRTPEQANRMLRQMGLEPAFQGNEPSETIAAGLVARQLPDPGQRVARGSDIRYWVSSGRPVVDVPNVTGATFAQAQRALVEAGLEVGERNDVFDEAPVGTVLAQNPRAGEEVRVGTPIDLTVSRGPETGIVPDVIGQTEADAAAILANAGFRVARIEGFNDQVPEGRVFDQDPEPNSEAESGSTVQISVSRGAETFDMPDVIGMEEDDAIEELESRGLEVQVRRVFTMNPNAEGRVIDQAPDPGTTVRRGQTVRIEVGSG